MEQILDKKAFNEIEEIIKHLSQKLQSKIPKSFIEFVENNKDENYMFEFDENKTIDNQNLLEDTKVLLTIIYREYLAAEEERKRLDEILVENERKYQEGLNEKYNSNNIFKKKTKQEESQNVVAMVQYKESILNKIINKIKKYFRKSL